MDCKEECFSNKKNFIDVAKYEIIHKLKQLQTKYLWGHLNSWPIVFAGREN